MSDTLVAEKRTGWRRHDIVYSPDLKIFGTVSSVDATGWCVVEFSNGVRLEYASERLDEWQRINDERGRP